MKCFAGDWLYFLQHILLSVINLIQNLETTPANS